MTADKAMQLVYLARMNPEAMFQHPKTMEVLNALYDEVIRQRGYIEQLHGQLDAQ